MSYAAKIHIIILRNEYISCFLKCKVMVIGIITLQYLLLINLLLFSLVRWLVGDD